MITDSNALLQAIGADALRAAPDEWLQITINVSGAGSGTEIESSVLTPHGAQDLEMSINGDVALDDLREAMYQEGTGTWYRATFTIDSAGQIEADFDYDAKPYDPMDEGQDYITEMLLEDQDLYPRDQDHLPDWHPAKTR